MASAELEIKVNTERLVEVLEDLSDCAGEMCPACCSKLAMWLSTNSWKWMSSEMTRDEERRG